MQSQVTFASEASGSRRPKTCVGGFVYFLDMGHYPTPPHYPHTPLITPIPPHYSHTLPHYWHGIFKHVGIWLKYLLSNICTTHNSKKVIKKYPNFCCYFPGFTDYYSPDPVFTNFLAPSHYSHTPPYYLHSTPLPPLHPSPCRRCLPRRTATAGCHHAVLHPPLCDPVHSLPLPHLPSNSSLLRRVGRCHQDQYFPSPGGWVPLQILHLL